MALPHDIGCRRNAKNLITDFQASLFEMATGDDARKVGLWDA